MCLKGCGLLELSGGGGSLYGSEAGQEAWEKLTMTVFPSFLFLTRKAKVGKFMCSCPFWTGCTKAFAGTTISVVVLIMETSTVESDRGRWSDGAGLGEMSWEAMVAGLMLCV